MSEPRPKIHLICNAHLDPVWLWSWEDGLTEALSTFRVACDFCDDTPGFIFCHNEAVLYQWVEENDPVRIANAMALLNLPAWPRRLGATRAVSFAGPARATMF